MGSADDGWLVHHTIDADRLNPTRKVAMNASSTRRKLQGVVVLPNSSQKPAAAAVQAAVLLL